MTSRKRKQIEQEIKKLKAELDGMSRMDAMGARELARAAGVSPTTAVRAKRGEILDHKTMIKLLPFMNTCPCCDREMTPEIAEKVAASFRRREN